MRFFRPFAVCIAVALIPCARAEQSADLLLGNPSGAGAADKNNFLLIKPTFVVSYNNDAGEPNWVSWELDKGDVGDAARKREFSMDVTLPSGFKLVTGRDYVGCGFDRGHLCPHGDRAATKAGSYSTFVMTNIVPQSAALNRNAWNQEEIYLRSLATDGHRLYIVAGPTGKGGTGSQGPVDTIAKGHIVVPAACWKIAIVVPDNGVDDVKQITARTRVIAVLMPNDKTPDLTWGQYRTSVAEIEKKTGLHFFNALPAAVASALKQKVDAVKLPPPVQPEWIEREKADAKAGSKAE